MSGKFIWLVPGSLGKCHGTHMKLFPEKHYLQPLPSFEKDLKL
jgi:hypothetical protein